MSLVMREKELSPNEQYLETILLPLDPYEARARLAAEQVGLSGISLSKSEAHLLRWFVQLSPGFRAVEVGTLTGLSGLYILDGLKEGGELWTLEKNAEHIQLARPHLEEFANKSGKKINLVEGDARETLKTIAAEAPFDFVFIDGNKAAYLDYLQWAENHTCRGTILVADNVFLSGEQYSKKQRQVMQEFNKNLLESKIWRTILVPTTEGMLVAERMA